MPDTDYSRECRKLANEIAAITGHNPYSGSSGNTFYLDTGYVHSGPEAVGQLTVRRDTIKDAAGKRDRAKTVGVTVVEVRRDGEVRMSFDDPDLTVNHNAAFKYLLKVQGMSTDWAIKYEGWSVVEVHPNGREHIPPEWKK